MTKRVRLTVTEVPADPLLWTVDEVAALLRTSMAVVERYADSGLLPFVQLETGPRRFRPQDVRDFVAHLPARARRAAWMAAS